MAKIEGKMRRFAFKPLPLKGAFAIQPFASFDERGSFVKDYSNEVFQDHGLDYQLQEVFYTSSCKGVIRALHFQRVKQQPKLVRCISGHIYDVIVDLRRDSPTFKKWIGFDLTGDNMIELLIPSGFGHGYLVIDDSIVSYKCAEKFYGEFDAGIFWNDPTLGIEWPLEKVGGISKIIVSEKDKHLPSFEEHLKMDF